MPANDRPYSTFNFSIEIYPDGESKPLCEAAFSECDGLEMTMDVQTIRSGGANDRAWRVPSVVNYSNLSLKRGMTKNHDLWKWFRKSVSDPYLRANAELIVFADDGKTEQARYRIWRCIPTKVKVPPLNAKDGAIAVEEFQLAYDKFEMVESSGKAPAGADA